MLQQCPNSGVWLGRLTTEEMNSPRHGIWTIGDEVPPDLPGHTKKLRYKSWYGHPKKYAGRGHRVAAGAHNGWRELVMVMRGQFLCEYDNTRHNLSFPACVDLPTKLPRTWRLPKGQSSARGCTLCRPYRHMLRQPGEGRGYEFHPFDVSFDNVIPPCLYQPDSLQDWMYQYVEVFLGRLNFILEGANEPCYLLHDDSHLFLPRRYKAKQKQWSVTPARFLGRAYGVVIYF